MITIEASHVNWGGSLVLLMYLIKTLDGMGIKAVVYLKYEHIFKEMSSLNLRNVIVVKTTTFRTICRYMKKRRNALFFCSLPPFVISQNSIVYFHSEYYSQKFRWNLKDKSFRENLKSFIYYYWICIGKYKATFFCQTSLIKNRLWDTYRIQAVLCPFFELTPVLSNGVNEKKYDFIYPALDSYHKNHLVLLNAIRELRTKRAFSIVLTIPQNNKQLVDIINSINVIYPNTIVNMGILTSEEIRKMYSLSKALIFPSTMESLGLPLIEGIHNGLVVLSSDMDYTYNAITNPVVFDPYNQSEIVKVMEGFLNGKYSGIKQDVKIENLIKVLTCH